MPPLADNTTIAAIATAKGQGGVAIIRLSGPDSTAIIQAIFKTSKPVELKPHKIYHGWIQDENQNLVDEVLVLCFKAPHSFTGEDVMEIHCHGGDFLSHRILELCFANGATPAEPGEFTKRAFLSGKLDLTQAESVMDLVSAQNERLLSLAANNLKNRGLGQALDAMCVSLIELQTQLIAHTDFPDEVDAPDRSSHLDTLLTIQGKLSQLAHSAERNQILREGFLVAILGLPNSGKSSLFNTLLTQERAIVTEIAGTTRDVITESLHIDGVHITLLDTAGIREADNPVETLGIARSWEAAKQAQAVLYVYDIARGLTVGDQDIVQKIKQPCLLLGNKVDLNPTSHTPEIGTQFISAKTGDGINGVFAWLRQQIHHSTENESAVTVSLNRRQRHCLNRIIEQLELAHQTLANEQLPIDLVTVPLSDALREFDTLNGRDTSEAVLSEVFSQFCVGK